MKFEEKLQKLRKASNLSQEQLADKLNVSRQAVSKWESGASYPEMDKLIQMSKIFKCSLDELVNDEETDTTIFKNQTKKRNIYLDSFMEFITKSINMFSNMKFLDLLRCICELIIIAFIIGVGVVGISFIIEIVLQEVLYFSSNEKIWLICNFFSNLLSSISFIILLVVGIIIFIQIYKIRYLDYYDKLMYEYQQKKDLENEEQEKKAETKIIKIEPKKQDRIIIRDPEHEPFAFLSIFSKFIINIFKGCLAFFSLAFVFSLIFAITTLVISIYLLSMNSIFIGVIVGIIGFIILNLVILDWNFRFIHNLKLHVRLLFILSIIGVSISSVGAGIFIINLKNIEFIEYEVNDTFVQIKEEIPFDKNINSLKINQSYSTVLRVDDSVEDLRIEFLYNAYIHNYVLNKDSDVIEFKVEPRIKSIKEAIDFTLEELKSNRINLYDLYDIPFVEITSNRENIEYIINNLEELYNISYNMENNQNYYWLY